MPQFSSGKVSNACTWDLSYTAWKCSELYQLTSHSGQQCVSEAELDRVAAQLNTWQNLTVLILKRFLPENPGILRAFMLSSLWLWLLWVNLPFYSFTAWDCLEPVAPPSGPKPTAAGQNWQTLGRTWKFAPALADTNNPGVVPPFVGNDYFCDIGHHDHWQARFYPDDSFWDVRGCGPTAPAVSTPHPGSVKNYPIPPSVTGQCVQW